MNKREVINLDNLSVSEPKIFEVEGKFINLEGFFFMENVVKKIVVENYAGLRQISVYSDSKKIAKYPLMNKMESLIEQVAEDDNEIVLIKVR
jgi:hypothetical protein